MAMAMTAAALVAVLFGERGGGGSVIPSYDIITIMYTYTGEKGQARRLMVLYMILRSIVVVIVVVLLSYSCSRLQLRVLLPEACDVPRF